MAQLACGFMSEDNSEEAAPSPKWIPVDSRDEIQVIRLGTLPTEPSHCPDVGFVAVWYSFFVFVLFLKQHYILLHSP